MDGQPAAEQLRAWLALVRAPGLGPVHASRLLEQHQDPVAVLAAGAAGWRAAGIADRFHAGLKSPDWAAVDTDQRWLETADRALISIHDPRYPARLREIAAAPIALFTLGHADLLGAPQIGVVGARAASAQGRENAHSFAAGLVRGGFTITSGLAIGIDGAAHRGALEANGSTIAVCANGLDRVYPARHRELAHQIAEHGLLISEFSPGTAPLPQHFPRRNRIISGLSLGVLVVEGARASGSMITARLAAEQGREVFAIPGSIHNPLAQGCHALIRDGARLVELPADIFEELGLPPPEIDIPGRPQPKSKDPLQARVLAALGHDALSLDRLIEQLEVPMGALHEALLALELTGQVSAAPGDIFSRIEKRR